jgi:hypothetical protein
MPLYKVNLYAFSFVFGERCELMHHVPNLWLLFMAKLALRTSAPPEMERTPLQTIG